MVPLVLAKQASRPRLLAIVARRLQRHPAKLLIYQTLLQASVPQTLQLVPQITIAGPHALSMATTSSSFAPFLLSIEDRQGSRLEEQKRSSLVLSLHLPLLFSRRIVF